MEGFEHRRRRLVLLSCHGGLGDGVLDQDTKVIANVGQTVDELDGVFKLDAFRPALLQGIFGDTFEAIITLPDEVTIDMLANAFFAVLGFAGKVSEAAVRDLEPPLAG